MVKGELIDDRPLTPEQDDGPAGPPPATVTYSPWWGRVALALTLLPLVVSALYLRLFHGDFVNTGDFSLTELQTRDIGHNWVELGAFSRDGWFHPGPALFYALAPIYRLLGGAAVNLHVAALAVNAAAIAGMGFVARRRGGLPLLLVTLVAVALAVRTLGVDPVRMAWNPWMAVLPYGLVLLLVWAMACGERWALPAAVVAGTFAAQTHVGYVALALPLVILGAVWLVVATPAGERRRLVVPALVAGAAAAVMWLPPAVEALTNDPGNARTVVSWFREGGNGPQEASTLSAGWNVAVTSQWSVLPEWAFGNRPPTLAQTPAALADPRPPVLLLVVAAASLYLVRRRVPGAVQLVAVWAVATVAGVVSTARTVGGVYQYRTGFVTVLGMIGGIVVLWAGWTALAAWRPRLERRVLVPGALAVLAALAVVSSVAHVQAGEPEETSTELARELLPRLVDALPPGEGDVVVDGRSFGAIGFRSAVVVELNRAGIDAYLPAGERGGGRHHMYDGDGPVRARLLVATDREIDHHLDEGKEMLVYTGSMPLDELRERAPASVQLEVAQERGVPGAFADEAKEGTIAPGTAVAVFLDG